MDEGTRQRLNNLAISGPTKYRLDPKMIELYTAGLVEARDEDSEFSWWRLTAPGILALPDGMAVADQNWPEPGYTKIIPPITPNGLPSPAKGG